MKLFPPFQGYSSVKYAIPDISPLVQNLFKSANSIYFFPSFLFSVLWDQCTSFCGLLCCIIMTGYFSSSGISLQTYTVDLIFPQQC